MEMNNMKQPVQYTDTHLTILGEKVEIKNDRFYATPQFFSNIIEEYKKETDFFNKVSYNPKEKVEIVIERIYDEGTETDKVMLRAYNLRSNLIWMSENIVDEHFEVVFRKVVGCLIACVVLGVLGYIYFS